MTIIKMLQKIFVKLNKSNYRPASVLLILAIFFKSSCLLDHSLFKYCLLLSLISLQAVLWLSGHAVHPF